MTNSIIALALLIGIFFLIKNLLSDKKWVIPKDPFPSLWRSILLNKVNFYHALSSDERALFENKIQEFLLNCKITGVEVSIDIADKILVAASAIIPVFRFPEWRYSNLNEVLIYPNHFNEHFETSGEGRNILGMVGTGYMEGKMILSKSALHHGFANETDKKNTAIHEFIHLIDKLDGSVDGVPALLLEKQYTIPWLDLINKKNDEIYKKKSDINPYGGTNRAEFFAVASEYFFERPKLLAKKNPVLYEAMEEIFDHEMDDRNLAKKKIMVSRNSPCPCDSGKKFKHCCEGK